MVVDREDARLYAERFLPGVVARAYLNEYERLLSVWPSRAAA